MFLLLISSTLVGQNVSSLTQKAIQNNPVQELEKMSNQELLSYWEQAQEQGYTLNQLKTLARAQGASESDLAKFENWFGNLLQTQGQDILRSKGILNFAGVDERYVFQGVHMLMDASPMGKWPDGKPRDSRVVFIGRNLDSMDLESGFEACKAT